MEKQEALKHLREVFKWFQGQTQESLKTLLPEITETEDDKFKKIIRLVLIATEGDQQAFYSTHGITRKECTDWLEKRAVRNEKNVRKYIASLAWNLHAETDLPYEECVRFAIQLGEDLLGVADGTVESGISDEDLEDFENEKCVRLAAAEMEATKDKEHAEKFLKSAGIMDKDGGLAEPYRNDIELGLDRALRIVEAARGKLDGYQTDDGIYECDHAIQVLSDFLDSKVWKPIKWNEDDEKMLWTVINSLSDVTRGEERNWLTERLRYLIPEPREWDSNVLPENADDKTINEKLISLVNWSGTPWSTKDKDQFVAYLEKLGSEKYVPCDGQCEKCACFQSGLHFQQEKKLEEEQKSAGWSYPYGKNETVDRLVSIAECLETDGDCQFNGHSGTECGKFLRELARKQVECKPAELSEDERIRKELIFFLKEEIPQCSIKEHADKLKEFVAYLEKQKEQKPEHFELEAGKWYFCHHAFCCRADHLTVQEGERFMCEKDGVVKGFVIKEPEKYFIECSAPAPMEDEQKEQKPAEWSEEDEGILLECISILQNSSHWVLADRLKSLRPQPKPDWSEEDETKLRDVVRMIEDSGHVKSIREHYEKFLNSLPERFNLRPEQEDGVPKVSCEPVSTENQTVDVSVGGWSKEDENKIERLAFLVSVAEEKEMISPSEGVDLRNFIKSLRPQPKPEWSERDERILYNVIAYIGYAAGQTGVRDELFKEANDWLKALRPQQKPEWSEHDSEMRMKVLKYLSTRCSVIEFEEVEDWLNELRLPWRPTWGQKEAVRNVLHPDDPYYIELNSLLSDLTKLYYGTIR